MKEYAAKIEAVRGGPDGDSKALEEWRKVVGTNHGGRSSSTCVPCTTQFSLSKVR